MKENYKLNQLVSKLVNLNIVLTHNNGSIEISSFGKEIPDTLVEEIKENKSSLITYLQSHAKEKEINIPPAKKSDGYVLSSGQRRLWVLSQLGGMNPAYNMPGHRYISGYDRSLLERSIHSLLQRHESLRTVFRMDSDGDVRQFVLELDQLGFEIAYEDFRGADSVEKNVEDYIANDKYIPFDLSQGPLIRISLLQVSDKDHVLYYNMHHIISDGWSMDILSRDILSFYRHYSEGAPLSLPNLRIQYKDYAVWQQQRLDSAYYDEDISYWEGVFAEQISRISLPSSKVRPRVQSSNGRLLMGHIAEDTSTAIRSYIEREGGTLYMFLLAALQALLYRYTNQSDIVIGSPLAGREHLDLEDQIGFYVNTLAFRGKVSGEEPFKEHYQKVRSLVSDGYAHQGYPFDSLVERLNMDRDTGRSALIDIMLVLQNTGTKRKGSSPVSPTDPIKDGGAVKSKFDVEITFKEVGDHLRMSVIYNEDVYGKDMILGMMHHYRSLMGSILTDESIEVGKLEYLSKQERKKLLYDFNDTSVDYPRDKTLVDLFQQQVDTSPDNIAVVFEDRQLSYSQLNALANQLARFLHDHHQLSGDDLIAISLQRSQWLVVAILGVLKSGCAYVPIDPSYPQERKDYMQRDSDAKVLIDQQFLSQFNGQADAYSKDNPNIDIDQTNLAYVIYTSGTTGRPKGVMVEHRGVLNLCFWHKEDFSLTGSSKATLYSSISFDASVWEIFPYLISGSSLYLLEGNDLLLDIKQLITYFEIHSITHSFLPSVICNELLNKYPEEVLDLSLLTGGEKIKYNEHSNHNIFNGYGTTENTVVATIANPDDLKTGKGDIGRPIANTQIYILSDALELQPIGVAGEICIGGAGLARGYLNQEGLTRQRFIPHPFKEGERLYKTGDLGRWLPNGTIEFLGRNDAQVKIRGHRIELAEIESVLSAHRDISQVLVLGKEVVEGQLDLVCYFVPDPKTSITHEQLRSYLSDLLPAYMVPGYFVAMNEFPLTNNGKVDRKALPPPEGFDVNTPFSSARNEVERILVSVFESVLGVSPVSIHDDFYTLGGDSIKCIQVVSRLKSHGYSLKVEDIMRSSVISTLSKKVKENIHEIDQSAVQGTVRLTPIQRWFFSNEDLPDKNHFNQSIVLESKVGVDEGLLRDLLEELTLHHDALRMFYPKDAQNLVQYNGGLDVVGYELVSKNYPQHTSISGDLLAVMDRFQSNFDISKGPLFKVLHLRLSNKDVVLIVGHHLVVDGVSWRILLEDLSTLYSQHVQEQPYKLPLKTNSFQDWSSFLEQYAQSESLLTEHSYWENLLDKQIGTLPVSDSKSEKTKKILSESFSLTKSQTRELNSLHQVYHTEINDLLLTALGVSLRHEIGLTSVLLQMEGHGRENLGSFLDTTRTVGWFTSLYPHLISVGPHNLTAG